MENKISIEKLSKSLDEIFKDLKVNKQELLNDFEDLILEKKNLNSFEIYDILINYSLKKCNFNGSNFNDLDWRFVASRLVLKKIYKEVANNRNIDKKKPYSDFENFYKNLSEMIYKDVYSSTVFKEYSKDFLERAYGLINKDNDLYYDFGGINILYNSYLARHEKKLIELPQEMYLLIALHLTLAYKNLLINKEKREDIREKSLFQKVKEIYNAISGNYISLATPILLNMRKSYGGYTSCIITSLSDDTDSMFHTFNQIAKLSSNGAGIGVNISRLRANNSWVRGTKGKSNGIINFIKILNDLALTFDQNGQRAGAITVALDNWHLDIYDFLELQTENGDLRKKAFDVFPQVVLSDLFMNRVKENKKWTLFDPFEVRMKYDLELCELYGDKFEEVYKKLENDPQIELKREVEAKELFKKIMATTIETGMPFIIFKDTINATNPNKHLGMIGNANLCVTPETEILTKEGYKQIFSISDQEVELWNGEQWSLSKVFKTGENQKILNVKFNNGSEVRCTEYHRFPIVKGYKGNFIIKEAKDLNIGDKIIQFDLPIIEGQKTLDKAYENGFLTIKGLKEKLFVPNESFTIQSRLDWFAGLCDSDGIVARHDNNQQIELTSTNKEFLLNVKKMLSTLGTHSSVILNFEGDLYRIIVSSNGVYKLLSIGFKTNRFKLNNNKPQTESNESIQISEIVEEKELSDTYCFTEPLRNMGIFNGVLLMNCIESFSNFSPTLKIKHHTHYGYDHTCNLLSYNLSIIKKAELPYYVELGTEILNYTIDLSEFTNYESIKHNDNYRIIGGGIMGLHDYLALNKIKYADSSKECEDLMEIIQFYSLKKSNDLAKNLYNRTYHYFPNSEYNKGIICGKDIEWFKTNTTHISQQEWIKLIEDIKINGLINGSLNNIPPNTRTSLVCGTTSSFLPTYSKFFIDKNSSSNAPIVPKHLNKDTFWYYTENQNMDQNVVVKIASSLQKWIDQGISMELWLNHNAQTAVDIYNLFMNAWSSGCKGIYYTRQKKQTEKKECISCAN